jgi:hypothetical protein
MHSQTSRRDFLVTSTSAMLATGMASGDVTSAGEANPAAGPEDFDFLAVNDLHFSDPAECEGWFARAFAGMRKSAPTADFLLVGGDLANDATTAQLAGARAALDKSGIRFHPTPGNHDVAVSGARDDYLEHFPGTDNYHFLHKGWQILSLDTVEDQGSKDTRIPAGTFAWLEKQRRLLDPRLPTIVSTHFPLGTGAPMRPANADALLSALDAFNIRAIFNGHWHGLGEVKHRDATISTNRCCSRVRGNADGSPAKGWFVCRARAGVVHRTFTALPE